MSNTESSLRKKSLAILLPDLSGGGAERLFVNLAPAFQHEGYDIAFLLHRKEGVLLEALPPGIEIVTLGQGRTKSAIFPLAKFLRRVRPDILIAALSHNNIAAILAAMLARVPTRVIVSEHNVFSLDCAMQAKKNWRYKILPLLYRIFLRHADAIIAVSHGVANDLATAARIPRGRISVIENAVVTPDFERLMDASPDHPWFESNAPVFVSAGRMNESKDFATLIKAFALAARQKDIKLILLGDGPLRAELEALARTEGVSDRVAMPGYRLNPLPFLKHAAALVLSSQHEGFGNILVEAMACGTPVISTDCPYGPREVLAQGRFGRLVPPGNPAALAQAMLTLLDNPPLDKDILRARAREFSVTRSAGKYITLFNKFAPKVRQDNEATQAIIVGQFPEDSSLIKGGVQASTYGLARAFHEGREVNDVKVIALPLKAGTRLHQRTVDGIYALFLNAPYRFLASSILHLRRAMTLIRSQRNPVLHVHGTGFFQAALGLAARWNHIPLVWTLHGITEKETFMRWRAHKTLGNAGRYLLYRSLERLLLRIAPDIVIDTPYVRDAIPPTRNRVHVIPQGIFTTELLPLRDKEKDPHLVLAVGVIAPRKGHHLLLEAFAKLRAQRPDAKLVIAGALAIPDYAEQLRRDITRLGLDENVTLAINIPRAAILDYLGQARVFALHSAEESQGIALCEALTAGIPVVATRIGGIPHVVTDGKNGILTAYGDTDGFAAAILKLLRDDEIHAAMRQHGMEAGASFAWSAIAAKIATLYRQAALRARHAV